MIQWMMVLLIFPSLIFVGPAASIDQITAYASGMADFRCQFRNPQNYSAKQLIYSWEMPEKKENLVVAELYAGERKFVHVTERYKNRIMNFLQNGDLHLFNITLEDDAVYYCCVRTNIGHIAKIFREPYKLNVLANFSVPEISNGKVSTEKKDSVVNFHCTSAGGFPKPSGILWIVFDDNGTHHKICNLEPGSSCHIKNISQTFSISSDLRLSLKSNTNVTCTVLAHHNFSSAVLRIDVEEDPTIPDEKADNLIYIVPCAVLIGATVIACSVYFCSRKNGKTCTRHAPRPSQNNIEIAQMREETVSFVQQDAEDNVS